ncbi:MAG: LCP family protein [Christensenellaceae bacterium]|nr:LCP family protein [Christensenellaceae bacterium]
MNNGLKRLFSVVLFACVLFCATFQEVKAEELPYEQVYTPEQRDAINAALEDGSKLLPVGEEFRIKVKPDDLSIIEGLDDTWKNILLLGTDTGNIKLNYGRTDAMLVLSVNKRTGELKLTSLVRDMFVKIPNTSMHNRINAANAFGGPLLAVKTVNETLGLNIKLYASINFSGFKDVVDALGGVDIEITDTEARIIGIEKLEGAQTLSGDEALQYVRIRKIGSNFGRNERQRTFLVALLNKIKNSDIDTAIEALILSLSHMATNMSINDILPLVPLVIANQKDMAMLSLPAKGDYALGSTSWGASVVYFNRQKTKDTFMRFVYLNED